MTDTLDQPTNAPELPLPPRAAPPTSTGRRGDRPRVPGWLATVTVVALVVALIAAGYERAGAVLIGFAVLVPIERLFRRHEQRVLRPGLRADVVHLLLSGALGVVFVLLPVLAWSVVLRPFLGNPLATAFGSQPGWLIAIEAGLAAQVLGYWAHRLAHQVPLLWRFHQVHHASEQLDWIAAARIHPMDGIIVGVVIGAPLLLLGVQPGTLGAIEVVTQLWAITLHMNLRWRLRPLDGIVGTTEYHHWHHSSEPAARDKNFAGLLPVIDRIFGTYYLPTDRRPERYGLDVPAPQTWFAHMAMPFRRASRAA